MRSSSLLSSIYSSLVVVEDFSCLPQNHIFYLYHVCMPLPYQSLKHISSIWNCCDVISQYLLFERGSLSSICSRFGFALQNLKKLKNPRVLHGFLAGMLKWSLGRYLLSRGPDLEVLFLLGFLWVLGEDDHFSWCGSQILCVYHVLCNSQYDVMETIQKEDTNIFYLKRFKKTRVESCFLLLLFIPISSIWMLPVHTCTFASSIWINPDYLL